MGTATAGLILAGLVIVLIAAVGYFAIAAQGTARAREKRLENSIQTLRDEVEELRGQIRQATAPRPTVAEQPAAPAPPPVLGRSLNLSKRSQVLRLHQRGSRPDQIASLLDVPVNEVELVVKLHKLLSLPQDQSSQQPAFLDEI